MAVSTKIEPLDRDIQVIINQELSPEARKAALVGFAREQLAEGQRVNASALGRVPPHETVVDRVRGAPIESVQPEGMIVFEFELINEVVDWIAKTLRDHSPVKTGRYQRSHVVFADNAEVRDGMPIPPASEYAIISLVPYARKIERGLSKQAPQGVYEAVATLARQRFGNVAGIKFSFRSPLGGASHLEEWANRSSMVRKGRRMKPHQREDWLRRQPAIVVTVR